uniref:Uncharacterized protein n=1 Tax=Arundo donax TaxID=35708 RepID=A0A0A9CLZ9_ARUDO
MGQVAANLRSEDNISLLKFVYDGDTIIYLTKWFSLGEMLYLPVAFALLSVQSICLPKSTDQKNIPTNSFINLMFFKKFLLYMNIPKYLTLSTPLQSVVILTFYSF